MGRLRLNSLTSLRFLAAFLVLLEHSAGSFLKGTFAERLFEHGYIGVTFFFVLSGFVLTWSRRSVTRPRVFFSHRFARVWPLHAATWLIMVLLLVSQNSSPGAGPAVANLLLIHDWIPKVSYYISVNGPSWTLSCELFFYLLFPITIGVVQTWGRRRLSSATVVVAAVVVGGALVALGAGQATHHTHGAEYLVHEFPVFRFGQFLLGILLALLLEQGWRSPLRSLTVAVLLVFAPYVAVTLIDPNGPAVIMLDTLTLPGLWLLIAASAQRDLKHERSWLCHPWSVRLGQWSFALYLIQYPMIVALADLGMRSQLNVGYELLFLAGAVAVSGVAFVAFERPLERFLRGRLTPRSAPSITTTEVVVE